MKTPRTLWPLAILMLLAALQFSACSQRSEPSNQPARPTESKDRTYRTLNGQTVIAIVSSDELEIRESGANIVCKYTEKDNKLRVVVSALGTTTAKYYNITPQGLVGEHGEIYYEPATFQKLPAVQKDAARMQIKMLETALDAYNMKYGMNPPTLDEVKEFFLNKQVPTTPWNGEYHYSATSQRPGYSYELSCTAPDGTIVANYTNTKRK